MVRCITGARFTMKAEVLTNVGKNENVDSPATGQWLSRQDPITGEINNYWEAVPVDNPNTPEVETDVNTIPCLARGVVDGGIRVAGTTENFGDWYENVEYVKLWTPARFPLKKGDRVTNIREAKTGRIVWKDEEYDDEPTVFDVQGCTPLFDAFNRHVENYIMLKRSDANTG